MSVSIVGPALNIREELAKQTPPPYSQQKFDFTGDTVETTFALPAGWKPLWVSEAGLIQREASGATPFDYTVTQAGSAYSVVMTAAPAAVDLSVVALLV